MRVGSLFSGAGGLDVAVEAHYGATTAWHCESDPHAAAVLAARWPGVPNLGDITTVDWRGVEPVDVLCGGFPCQDLSAAGKRAGMSEGTRSGLWTHYARAISVLRPRWVVIENVRGLLTLTTPDGRKAIDRVTDDLSSLHYSSRRVVLPASFVGAPHKRERVFILAWPAAYPMSLLHSTLPTPVRGSSTLLPIPLLPTPRATDGTKGGPNQRGSKGDLMMPSAACQTVPMMPTQSATKANWEKYGPAVARWEELTRPAPYPVEPNKNDRPRLVAAFSEWMMGWPPGWVTDFNAYMPRSAVLRIIGNGVVTRQAAAALELLS